MASLPLLSPRSYFNLHAADVREFIPVTMLHGLKPGDPYLQGPGDGAQVRLADREGYFALTDFFENDEDGFLSAQQVVERTYDLSQAAMIAPREPLPENFIDHPVGIGQEMQLGTPENPRTSYAPLDGFVVNEDGEKSYMSNLELVSIFNYHGRPPQTRDFIVAAFHSSAPLQGVIAREDVRIMMSGEPFLLEKGGALLKIPKGPDLYYGALPPRSARTLLRREPKVLAAPCPGKITG